MRFLHSLLSVTEERLRKKQLEDARIDVLDHIVRAEYHAAMATMLTARIKRLEAQSKPLD